jgi:S1-C subfamily serine protease
VKAQFTIQSGSRAGQIDVLSQPFILVGRHPQCELRFDADQDLDVSARHASVTLAGKLYVLRDLGSTNGTMVNGQRLTGDHVLASQDIIQFGTSGPRVEFASIPDPPPSALPVSPTPPVMETSAFPEASPAHQQILIPKSGSPGSFKLPHPTPGSAGATTRIKIAVQEQTKKHRTVQYVLFAMLLVVTGAYFWSNSLNARRLAAQRELLLGQVDSLVAQIGTLSGTTQALQGALDSAKTEAQRLKQRISASAATGPEIAQLKAQLTAATQQQRNLAQVATLDGAAIAAANRDAVAIVFVQFPDGRSFTGTAFAIQSDANGGLLVTNRHVVVDSVGHLPEKVGVVFNGSNQNFKADVVAMGHETDVALLKTSVHRGIPVVKGIATSRAEVGEPVAVIGFPLGLDLQKGADWRQLGVAATLTLGTVSRTLPDLIQLDSYGAQGSSGSPIFNRAGMVVGLIYGGEKGSNGRIVYGVPAGAIKELLLRRE